MFNKRIGKNEEGIIGILAVLIIGLIVLGTLGILVLLGMLVFGISLTLGVILVLGILLSIFGPWQLKILGGLMIIGAVVVALVMLVF